MTTGGEVNRHKRGVPSPRMIPRRHPRRFLSVLTALNPSGLADYRRTRPRSLSSIVPISLLTLLGQHGFHLGVLCEPLLVPLIHRFSQFALVGDNFLDMLLSATTDHVVEIAHFAMRARG